MHQLVITAIGPDRPGLVGGFTGHLHAGGANLADSRMLNLRGQFAMIVLVEGDKNSLTRLQESIPGAAAAMGLSVHITPHTPPAPPVQQVQGVPFRLKTYSMDRPGIVHLVSDLLQRHGVNIEDLQTRLESAAFAGTPLFTMEMRITVPTGQPVKKLRGELEALCEGLNCDVDLEPA